MSKNVQIRESRRYPFYAPVEIRWMDSKRQPHSVLGTTHDVSVYGLGVLVPRQVPAEQELTIILKGVDICGGAVLRHSRESSSGFKIGLFFRLTLLLQNVPELDDLLQESLAARPGGNASMLPSLTRRFGVRFWRTAIGRTRRLFVRVLPTSKASSCRVRSI